MKRSAGLLLYRVRGSEVDVLLGHPGGPYFRKKDHGSWTIPKGLLDSEEEDPLDAARREFTEETGLPVPEDSRFRDLGETRMKSGKRLRAWAFSGDCDPATLESNDFEIEWPPRSGRRASFPEIDRFAFFDVAEAAERIHPAQVEFLRRLLESLAEAAGSS